MKILNFNRIGATLIGTFILLSCSQQEKFTIKGNIANGEGHTLYLSHIGIQKSSYIDSAKLDKRGDFTFSNERPECYDFYRLQLDKKGRQITIAIDSTEIVTVNTDAASFIA